MLFFVAILAIVLLGVAVTLVVRGAFSPANQETVEQISAYGYASNAGAYVEKEHRSVRDWFDGAASWLGERLGRRFSALREREIRATPGLRWALHDERGSHLRLPVPLRLRCRACCTSGSQRSRMRTRSSS